MALPVLAVLTLVNVASQLYGGEQQRKASSQAADESERQARNAQERAEREEQIAREKKAADVSMARERMDFEKETRGEKAEFVIGQMNKRDAEVYAAAIAGFAASGVEVKGGSVLAVLNKIKSESATEIGEVTKDFETFVESRDIEFKQLKETRELSYDWFTSRLHQETQWEVTGRYAEASAYRSKGRYAQYGGYLSAAGTALSGYASASSYGNFGSGGTWGGQNASGSRGGGGGGYGF